MKPFLCINDKLTLHLARPELAEPVFKIVDTQRQYLRQWLPWVDSTRKVEDTKIFIRESMQHNTNGTRLTTFILAGEEVAGALGVVHFIKDHKKCEIGYWLGQDFQGQGMMTKACATLIDHLFRTKDLNRIEIKAAVGNERSRAVPQRLGFTSEGIEREALYMYKTFHDLEGFSLLKRGWKQQNAHQNGNILNFNQKI